MAGVHASHALSGFFVVGVTMAPSMKHALWQVVPLHTFPLAQAEPSETVDQPVSSVAGSHFWQALDGLGVPVVTRAPVIQHPAAHVPAWQKTPAPQSVPLARFDHVVVDVPGVQTAHGFWGSTAPLAWMAPSMKHLARQLPSSHTFPAPQAVPGSTLDHAVVETDG